MYRVIGLLLAACTLGMSGCSGLPDNLVARADRIPDRLSNLKTSQEESASQYGKLQNSSQWEFLAPYAAQEEWDATLPAVAQKIGRLEQMYSQKIKPIVEENEPEKQAALTAQLKRFDTAFKETRDAVDDVHQRAAFIVDARKNAEKLASAAGQQMPRINALVNRIEPVIEQAKTDFPEQETEIDKRFAPLEKQYREAADAYQVVQDEYEKHVEKRDPDYAAFADKAKRIENNLARLDELDKKLRKEIDELSHGFTRILVDMKVEHSVTVGRTSWNNYSDANTDRNHVYDPVKVSEDDYFYLTELPATESRGGQGKIVEYTSSWGSKKIVPHIREDVWDGLDLSPKASWPSRHDRAVYWLSDWNARYYHKYELVSGTDRELTDWEEVGPEKFSAYSDALGMAIETKPLGAFASETIWEPTPPGLAMVGNDRYGEWRQNDRGNSVWHYYGQYAFWSMMLGSNNRIVYGRNDYDNWRQHRTSNSGAWGYYGADRSNPVYGSRGRLTKGSSRFNDTTYNRSGGFRRSASSVRGAGPSGRGRGPGGGGK